MTSLLITRIVNQIVNFIAAIWLAINSLGRNPKRGGRPPSEKSLMNMFILLTCEVEILVICLIWKIWLLFKRVTRDTEIRL